jgi:hypothetical protein
MNNIIKRDNLKNISEQVSVSEIYSNNESLELRFPEMTISFRNPLVYKFGFPNNEVSSFLDIAKAIDAEDFFLYTIKDTDWLKSILKLNSNHPKHSDKIFETYSHFLLFLEDDTFVCIAESFNIIQK